MGEGEEGAAETSAIRPRRSDGALSREDNVRRDENWRMALRLNRRRRVWRHRGRGRRAAAPRAGPSQAWSEGACRRASRRCASHRPGSAAAARRRARVRARERRTCPPGRAQRARSHRTCPRCIRRSAPYRAIGDVRKNDPPELNGGSCRASSDAKCVQVAGKN